jgi:hypothetical protein
VLAEEELRVAAAPVDSATAVWPGDLELRYMRTYTDVELEIIGNRLGMLLGMKRTRDGLWLLATGNKTGLGLVRTLASILKNLEQGCLGDELIPTDTMNASIPWADDPGGRPARNPTGSSRLRG